MNINDEAVEAARVAIEREFPYDENAGYMARLALTAAAPHVNAAAWQEGFIEAIKAYAPTPSSGVMNNPYRDAEVME